MRQTIEMKSEGRRYTGTIVKMMMVNERGDEYPMPGLIEEDEITVIAKNVLLNVMVKDAVTQEEYQAYIEVEDFVNETDQKLGWPDDDERMVVTGTEL